MITSPAADGYAGAVLPFARLNLRWNPFGEVPEQQRGSLTVVELDIDRVAERLARPGFALELLGPCGHGKSSHLFALHQRFLAMPLTYVDVGTNPRIPHASVVFVDESQHLPASARRRLFRRRASFVLATHQSHAAELRAHEIHVETLHVSGVGVARMPEVVKRRIEWARLGPGPVPVVPEPLLRELAQRHGDDLRTIGDALYDWFQRRKESPIGEL